MDKDKIASLHSTFSVDGEVSDNDTRFLKITVDVMNVGENYNGSYFSKEVIEENIDSIKNTPILGYIEYDKYTRENDFKGHEYVITRTENGVEQKYVGQPFGVVPESCSPRFITKTTDSGREVETLQVDALMWEKFSDATGILKRDSEKSQSMELAVNSIDGYDDEDDGLFHFTAFKFDGCTILGECVQPAMENANVKINDVNFSVKDFVKSLQSELNDKFTVFAKLMNEQNVQGGVRNMPEDIKDDKTIEDVKTDFSEDVVDDVDDVADDDAKPASDFANTMMQQFEDISHIVASQETVKDYWGDDVPRYYAVDVQDDEVIVVDAGDSYHYYGIPYTMDGDKPVLDFACGTRKKVRYENYEDGAPAPSGVFDFGEHIASIEKKASERIESVESDYSAVKSELDEIRPKYDEYVAADEKRAADELNAAKDAKLAEYEDALGESADFAAIKDKKDELSVDEIEKECAVLYVKNIRAAKTNFSKNPSSPAVGIINDGDDDTPDGYVKTKYGDIKRRY